MKRNRFSEEQIIGILKEHEAGIAVSDLCRKHGVSDASIYKWKAKFEPPRDCRRPIYLSYAAMSKLSMAA